MPRIQKGTLAPLFKALTYDGKLIDLSAYLGRRIWLSFYRYATCPLCCLQLEQLAINSKKLEESGLVHIAIFESPPGLFQQKICGQTYPLFPMISDPRKFLYQAYGTEVDMKGLFYPQVLLKWLKAQFRGYFQGRVQGTIAQMPADFLINEFSIVQEAYYGKHISDHIPWEQVEVFLKDAPLLPLPTSRKSVESGWGGGLATHEVTVIDLTNPENVVILNQKSHHNESEKSQTTSQTDVWAKMEPELKKNRRTSSRS